MHTITLKSDDKFYDMLNDMVNTLKITKSELIRKAVTYYQTILYHEQLKQQIKQASMKVRKQSKIISNEFNEVNEDGLNNV